MITNEDLVNLKKLAEKPWINIGIRLPQATLLLIQEVRRLREELRVERADIDVRWKRLWDAEAEVGRLKHELTLSTNSTGQWREYVLRQKTEAEAERDRYKAVVDAARNLNGVYALDDEGYKHWYHRHRKLDEALVALDETLAGRDQKEEI